MQSCGTCKWWDGERKNNEGYGNCTHINSPFFGDYREVSLMYESEGTECATYYKPKKVEAFHQKDVPGILREISGVDEARDLGESAAKCMTELMQAKEGG